MWSAINYKAYNSNEDSVFCLNGTYRYRIQGRSVFEWGIAPPDEIPVTSVGATTGLTGDYNAKYTYARREGRTIICESNAGNPDDAATTLANESLMISVTAPEDPQVNLIRFYRTAADGAIYYYDQQISYGCGDYAYTYDFEFTDEYISDFGIKFTDTADGWEQIYSWESLHTQYAATDSMEYRTGAGDNVWELNSSYTTTPGVDSTTADASLGTVLHTDHNRPPLGSYIAGPSYSGYCFVLKSGDLYYCKAQQPEYWPSTYFVTVAPPQETSKCIVFFDQVPFVITDRNIYYVEGTAHGSFVPRRVASQTGTVSSNGALAVDGHGIFHVAQDGIYLCMPSTSSRFGSDKRITGAFYPIFYGESVNGVPAAGDLSYSFLANWDDKLYFFYPGESDTYPTNALVFYLSTGRVGYCNWSTEMHHATRDIANNRLVAISSEYSWVIEDETVTTDDGSAISWEVESKEFTLQTRRHFPRWCKYDVDAQDASDTYGYLKLDGSVHQTHAITGERVTKRRLIAVGNGRRCSLKLDGTGPVEIYAVESE